MHTAYWEQTSLLYKHSDCVGLWYIATVHPHTTTPSQLPGPWTRPPLNQTQAKSVVNRSFPFITVFKTLRDKMLILKPSVGMRSQINLTRPSTPIQRHCSAHRDCAPALLGHCPTAPPTAWSLDQRGPSPVTCTPNTQKYKTLRP